MEITRGVELTLGEANKCLNANPGGEVAFARWRSFIAAGFFWFNLLLLLPANIIEKSNISTLNIHTQFKTIQYATV